MDLVSN